MTELKHTPGPWGWSHREIPSGNYSTQVYDANEKEIATIAWYPVRQNNITTTSREANARLIAAAPELLEALQAIVDCCNEDSAARDYVSRQTEIHGIARYAISKAIGVTK